MNNIYQAYRQLATKSSPLGRPLSLHGGNVSLTTKGNQILDQDGTPIILKGVSFSGLEYLVVDVHRMTPDTIHSDLGVMKEWGIDTLRLPLRDIHWLNDAAYRGVIDLYILEAITNGMFIILDLHTQQHSEKLEAFMWRGDPSNDASAFWRDISARYGQIPSILFELFNEPHDIDPTVWWAGNAQYYGYRDIIQIIRQRTDHNCIILGGLDYAYQWSFLQDHPWIMNEMQTVSKLILATHPYGYKGLPGIGSGGETTAQIPHHIEYNTKEMQGDCHLGVTVPDTDNFGWNQSFGFLHDSGLFPVIATEWGLDQYDNCLQGGWYSTQLLRYLNEHNMGYTAWAWVQDRLDYPSLLGEGLVPTGEAIHGTKGPACGTGDNNFYQGPGLLVYNDLSHTKGRTLQRHRHHRRLLASSLRTNSSRFDMDVSMFYMLCIMSCICIVGAVLVKWRRRLGNNNLLHFQNTDFRNGSSAYSNDIGQHAPTCINHQNAIQQ